MKTSNVTDCFSSINKSYLKNKTYHQVASSVRGVADGDGRARLSQHRPRPERDLREKELTVRV